MLFLSIYTFQFTVQAHKFHCLGVWDCDQSSHEHKIIHMMMIFDDLYSNINSTDFNKVHFYI